MRQFGSLTAHLFGNRNIKKVLIQMERDIDSNSRRYPGDVGSLDELSNDLGDQIAGRFIAPASTATDYEPTDSGFTGAFMSGNGETFGSDTYHVGGVAAGVLQAGFSATTGKLVAGAGDVTIDASGIKIARGSGTDNAINWMDGTDLAGYINTDGSLTENTVALISLRDGVLNDVVINAYGDGGAGTANTTVRLSGGNSGTYGMFRVLMGTDEIIRVRPIDIVLNYEGRDTDIVINGKDDTIATFDAALNAVGFGTAADGDYIAKFVGHVNIDLLDVDTISVNDLGVTGSIVAAETSVMTGGEKALGDDTAYSFTPSEPIGIIIFSTTADATVSGIYVYNTDTSASFLMLAGTNTVATTGALAGTTGTNGKYTISNHTDGKIYIENRMGGARTIRWSILAGDV